MTEALPVKLDKNGKLIVSGHLDFVSIPFIWEQSLVLMPRLTDIQIDFSHTDSVASSAVLALLVEWIRYAKKAGKSLQLTGLPEQSALLIKTSGLQDLLEKYMRLT